MNIVALAMGLAMSLPAAPETSPGTAVTVYNQQFGVVRERLTLDLSAGANAVSYADATAHLEPDSVILRDPSGQHPFRIAEQSYRNDPVSVGLLLSKYEGKEIDFLVQKGDTEKIVRGRIVRSGYVPHYSAFTRYGQAYAQRQSIAGGYGGQGTPIIEVDGKLRFGTPGLPLFPELTDDSILKPTLQWEIESETSQAFDAELAYVTGGMSWEADYNLVAPEDGDKVDIVGWVTVDNQCGKSFKDARLKLVAGDVNKLEQTGTTMPAELSYALRSNQPAVEEKSFDEYHLYTIARPTSLRDRETKQIEFVRASGVEASRFYVYDGAALGGNYWLNTQWRNDPSYGSQTNSKVWVMREFENTEANGLGIALPRGGLRFYRQDSDGQLEFTGEDTIDHTPRGETVRLYTGNAFDIVGERRATNFVKDPHGHWMDETFEIRVRNRKDEAVEVRVVEHLYRWSQWEITAKSHAFEKKDARTIEFRIQTPPDEEQVITYTVHYEAKG